MSGLTYNLGHLEHYSLGTWLRLPYHGHFVSILIHVATYFRGGSILEFFLEN